MPDNCVIYIFSRCGNTYLWQVQTRSQNA